jgi:pSer/pThr/pTyr-binding forkhead associated (FHA) protein
VPHPIIIVTLNGKEIERKELNQELIAIGRDMDNDIVINNLAVSRCHVIIQVNNDKLFVKDMASANGTFVNGQKIEECELKDGDLMLIGKHILKVEMGDGVKNISESSNKFKSSEIDNGTVIYDVQTRDKFLEKLESEKKPKNPKLTLDDGKQSLIKSEYFTIGKRYDADVIINGLFINEHHAVIQKQSDGSYKIINMGTFIKPVKVNGKVIKEKILVQDDLIQIGNFRFNYSQ